ncbi:RNA polymerase factor sigma-54 [Porphyromonas macacae]|uniref:RNA polymerase factor sigma-54 n=1 Tax=Porphyromonas macacae TaxID=28115 RepID=A0A379DI72_9PORP|nr:RNA polymerase factor sigma-54 [Porphyromonas macacae]SUB77723.1 RNA polymerase factor sigma-54 [Porphyromonas macacae]
MLKQSLNQKLQQSLTTAQIQQIKMLELPTIELETRIMKELQENPALDESFDEDGSEQQGAETDDYGNDADVTDLGDYGTEDDIPEYKLQQLYDKNARKEEIPFAANAPSLGEYLMQQLELAPLTDRERLLAPYIIGNINPDGYLYRTVAQLQDDLLFKAGIEADAEELDRLIKRVQQLDPPGVGARDLRECLLIQLQNKKDQPNINVAYLILDKHYDDFVNKRYERLFRGLEISEGQLSDAIHVITALNPKPGFGLEDRAETNLMQVHPDFVVEEMDGELMVYLTDERMLPPLRVNPHYRQMAEACKTRGRNCSSEQKEALAFARQKVEQARWFISAIEQRRNTLLRTMQAIAHKQESFLKSGEMVDLRPMILKDIADVTGFDISTISRVSNSKYVQTDYGIYPLKFFFNEGIAAEDGEEVSTRVVKDALREVIEAEDGLHPLSDSELVGLLAERGYPVARRTVAKYRNELGIPTARMRKKI